MEEIKNIAPEEVKNENVQSQENAQAVEITETLSEMPAEASEEATTKAQPQTKEEIINRLKELVHEADKAERAELEQLKQTYYRLHNAEVVAAREAFIAAGGAAEEFQPEADTLEEEFKAQMGLVKEMRAKLAEEQEQLKQENLRKKQAEEEAANADPEIDALVAARTEAKKAKNFAEADRIRDELKAMGVEIIDTPQGTKWRKV